MVKTLCIVQARLTSSRLPNKVLMPLAGKTILEHVNERLTAIKGVDKVVFAIPNNALNDKLEEFLKSHSIPYFRGDEDDVLDRFYQCAIAYNPTLVVRATCDNPLVDMSLAETLIKDIPGSDYIHCTDCSLGTSVEVFTMSALTDAHREATQDYEHEHVTPFIWKNKERYKVIDYLCGGPQYRLTVDEEKDYELMNFIFNDLYKGEQVANSTVYDYLSSHPELVEINSLVQQKTV